MTDEQLARYARMSIDHNKSIAKAIVAKASDIEALDRNNLSASTTTEVIAAHDAVILSLYNTIPTEQDAIDAVADVGV